MLLNQDQDLLADLSIAICSSYWRLADLGTLRLGPLHGNVLWLIKLPNFTIEVGRLKLYWHGNRVSARQRMRTEIGAPTIQYFEENIVWNHQQELLLLISPCKLNVSREANLWNYVCLLKGLMLCCQISKSIFCWKHHNESDRFTFFSSRYQDNKRNS